MPARIAPKTKIRILALVLGALALVTATWFLASLFQSPAQREAAARPPDPLPVLAEVVLGDLADETTTIARADFSGLRTVPLPPTENMRVVTAPGVSEGQDVSAGDIILWANGEPLFALSGPFPLYRDLVEGDTGADVSMLQQALNEVGCDLTVDGSLGLATANCLRSLYTNAGSTAPTIVKEGGVSPDNQDAASEEPDTASTPTVPERILVARQSAFLMLAEVPLRVAKVPSVGTELSGESATIELSSPTLSLTAEVPGPLAATLDGSLEGTATFGEDAVPVTISQVLSPAPSSDSTDDGGNADTAVMEFRPITGEFPSNWAGAQDVLVSFQTGKPLKGVLLVPQRAIAVSEDGTQNVLLQTTAGDLLTTEVSVSRCIAGECAIEEPTVLEAGSLVQVDR